MWETFHILNLPTLPLHIYIHQGQYQTNDLFLTRNHHQGVTGHKYTMADNTNTEHYIPTVISPVSKPEMYNQGCILVLAVAPYNHILSYDVHQRLPISGCQAFFCRIHGSPTPFYNNKHLHHRHMITSLGSWFIGLPLKYDWKYWFFSSILKIIWMVPNILSIPDPLWETQTGKFTSSYQ